MTKKKLNKDKPKKLNLAIIGSGISGLTSAMLLSKKHNITLYESNSYLGGHALTIDEWVFKGRKRQKIPFDVGFLVYNKKNYPLFSKLLNILKVKSFESSMSFSVSNQSNNFEYGSTGFLAATNSLKNIFNPKFWILLKEIKRFYRVANQYLESDFDKIELSVNQFLEKNNFNSIFIYEHLLPMCGAIWSIPFNKVLNMPLYSTLIFFRNHGLLSFFGKPKWKTIIGGSKNYVKAISQKINGDICKNEKVIKVVRNLNKVFVHSKNTIREYDKVIFATHADDTLKIIANPTNEEKEFLSNFKYESNYIHVHQDQNFMPKNKKIWSSWNVLTQSKLKLNGNICVTYWINKLQNIYSDKPILVTLNANKSNAPNIKNVLKEFIFRHPILNNQNIDASIKIKDIQGKMNTYFVGAWLGYGFHEDGVKSAVDMAKSFNIRL